jgi:hypothetical protein
MSTQVDLRRSTLLSMVTAQTTELAPVLGELERLLKSPSVAETLARAVNVSLALVALDGLRAYLKHGLAAEELGTAAEEIAARHKRARTEKPS